MAVFFTADTHFGDGGALGLYRRPFASVAEMDAAMAARWNETVRADDEVWHLGDFARRRTQETMASLLDALHGRKRLVAGNNDGVATRALSGWAEVTDYAEVMLDGVRLVLCHYALRTWRDMGRGAVNLHGHSHGRLAPMTRQFDVGVDARDFRPVTLTELRTGRGPR
jgi:calcineurin-like phosphoesterase family protein